MVERDAGLGVDPPQRKDGKGKRSPWGQLHKLRHTYGTRLAAAGVSARNIQELMGHEDLETADPSRGPHQLPALARVGVFLGRPSWQGVRKP